LLENLLLLNDVKNGGITDYGIIGEGFSSRKVILSAWVNATLYDVCCVMILGEGGINISFT